ncbi:MAG: hypothetical protein JWO93_2590 [Micrococcaceae bacterium]|jgi:hypothetical protein|nr:hypothetical protein [Micrococcaceae bacterium]
MAQQPAKWNRGRLLYLALGVVICIVGVVLIATSR